MSDAVSLEQLDVHQLRALAERLMSEVAERDAQIARNDQALHFKQTHIDQLTQELALYKRWRYVGAVNSSTRRRRACWTRRWMRTWPAIEEEVLALQGEPTIPQLPAVPGPRRMKRRPGWRAQRSIMSLQPARAAAAAR